jgi:hypothetical protein
MKYAEIFKNEVIRLYDKLPNCWKNISNFDALPADQIANLEWAGHADRGFLPLTEKTMLSLDEDTFDYMDGLIEYSKETHRLIGPKLEIFPDRVVAIWELIEKTRDELLQAVREQRDYLLSKCDWTQQPDVSLSEEKKREWRIYRQELRDITNENLIALLSDPFYAYWPQKPE